MDTGATEVACMDSGGAAEVAGMDTGGASEVACVDTGEAVEVGGMDTEAASAERVATVTSAFLLIGMVTGIVVKVVSE